MRNAATAAPVGFGEKPGIVVVDFQRAFTDPASRPAARRWCAGRSRTPRGCWRWPARPACRSPPATWVTTPRATRRTWKVAGIADLVDGQPGVELDPLIAGPVLRLRAAQGRAVDLLQHAGGGFLPKNRVDTMIVTGCITSGCVRAASSTASASASAPSCRRTASATTSSSRTEDNLRDVERRYADVSTATR